MYALIQNKFLKNPTYKFLKASCINTFNLDMTLTFELAQSPNVLSHFLRASTQNSPMPNPQSTADEYIPVNRTLSFYFYKLFVLNCTFYFLRLYFPL